MPLQQRLTLGRWDDRHAIEGVQNCTPCLTPNPYHFLDQAAGAVGIVWPWTDNGFFQLAISQAYSAMRLVALPRR
jgi:hypothetical protein